MKYKILIFILMFSLLITACGAADATPAAVETSTEAITITPDLCSAENLPAEVTKVNKLMREFDDYSSLASNTPQAQLVELIPEMQRILRDAEDLQTPACLQTLKQLQMSHMSLVIQILMAFMNNSDVETINAGIAQSRELHAQYDIEMARLLGVTLVIPPTIPPSTEATTVPPSTAAAAAYVTNPGPTRINLRSSPALNAPEAGLLDVKISAVAIGRSADSQWIKVEIPNQPGQTAWVFASLAQLSVPIDQLPVTE